MDIDAHAHLEDSGIPKDFIVVNNGLNLETNKKVLSISNENKNIKAALGLYPLEGINLNDKQVDEIISFITENKKNVIAVGEIGLDFKNGKDKKQIKIFERLLNVAKSINKPVIVHSRGAENEVLEILEGFKLKNVVMHHFSGGLSLINTGYYYTVNVLVTERKKIQELANALDVDKILTESDSPFVIIKGRKSSPEDVRVALEAISEIKELPPNKIKNIVFGNYQKCFHV